MTEVYLYFFSGVLSAFKQANILLQREDSCIHLLQVNSVDSYYNQLEGSFLLQKSKVHHRFQTLIQIITSHERNCLQVFVKKIFLANSLRMEKVVCFAANQTDNSPTPFFTLINTLFINNIVFFKFITKTFFFTLFNRK